MSRNDSAGRIHKSAYLATIIALFVVAMITVLGRFFIRIRLQRTFGVDDGFLLFGAILLIITLVVLIITLDDAYLAEAFLVLKPDIDFSGGNFYGRMEVVRNSIDACLALAWAALCCVKFSFLFLFRKLIDRLRFWKTYWWFVVGFCTVAWVYGTIGIFASCPATGIIGASQCLHGPQADAVTGMNMVQMALDVLGDILILVIPVRLIWQIQIRWTQKIALVLTLCLSLVMIALTLVRSSHIVSDTGGMDPAWGMFWCFVSAEVGTILASVSAFRAIFVGPSANRRRSPGSPGTNNESRVRLWCASGKRFVWQSLRPWTWSQTLRGKDSGASSDAWYGSGTAASDATPRRKPASRWLASIPRAQMTGMGTYIDRCGRTTKAMSTTDTAYSSSGEKVDLWALPPLMGEKHANMV